MRYAIIGTGGIGAYYGCRLALSGNEVHFVLRSDYDHVRENGFFVESVKGDMRLTEVLCHRSVDTLPPVDVVFVCTKTTANPQIFSQIAGLAASGSTVVLIQNGLGMEEDLAVRYHGTSIVGATAFICSSRVGPGHIIHAAYGELTLAGLSDGGQEKVIQSICTDLENAGVPCHISPSLPLMRWKKLVWNIPYNGLSVLHDCKTDELTFRPEYREQVHAMMLEVIAGAGACGVEIPVTFADDMIAATEVMAPYYPSMYLDWEAGRQLELGTIYAAPVETASRAGFEMKLTARLLAELTAKVQAKG